MSILILIAKLFYFFLPVACANMAPVVFQGVLKPLAVPVDFGKKLSGEPWFGDHKTWRGLFVATLAGGVVFIFQQYLAQSFALFRSFSPFDITTAPIWFGFAFGFGAILGDLIKSFFKRRFHVGPGDTWFPFDQIDFLIGACVVASIYFEITLGMFLLIISIGPIFHVLINNVGFRLQLKETPW